MYLLVQGINISVISVYLPQYGFDDNQKDHFYESLIYGASKFGDKKVVVTAKDFNGNV